MGFARAVRTDILAEEMSILCDSSYLLLSIKAHLKALWVSEYGDIISEINIKYLFAYGFQF